jgi:hypothetical protein
MAVTEDQDQFEKEKAEQIIAETPPMDGVENISVELGEDHSGDPAMWLVFHMRHDLEADDDWLTQLNKYSQLLSLKIIHSGLTRFPYTRLRRAA